MHAPYISSQFHSLASMPTGPGSLDGTESDIMFEIFWAETHAWSERLVVAGSTSVTSNSTLRHLFENAEMTGTPTKIRFSLGVTPNSDTWWPRLVAVRVNNGLWFETTEAHLCPVDGHCATAAECASLAPAGCSVTRSAEYNVTVVHE
mmetsp:Transcript_48053/g.75040  ORF Transcript_48053/g.75040 Transcript_48053/m.75040 type:complete len:148 (-) Transcript_48053:216-659(-)